MITLLSIEGVLLLVGLVLWWRARAKRLRARIAANEAAQNCPHGLRKWKKCRGCAEDFVREVEAERTGNIYEVGVDVNAEAACELGIPTSWKQRCLTLADTTPPMEQLRLLREWWLTTGVLSKDPRHPLEINEWSSLNQARIVAYFRIDPTKEEGCRWGGGA